MFFHDVFWAWNRLGWATGPKLHQGFKYIQIRTSDLNFHINVDNHTDKSHIIIFKFFISLKSHFSSWVKVLILNSSLWA